MQAKTAVTDTNDARVRAIIRDFALSTYTAKASGISALADTDSFTELEVFDSLTMMSLVSFLEISFATAIPVEDIVPENFDSIDLVCTYLERRGVLG